MYGPKALALCMSQKGIPRSTSRRSSTEVGMNADIALAPSMSLALSASAKQRNCAAMLPMRPACGRCAIACGLRCRLSTAFT